MTGPHVSSSHFEGSRWDERATTVCTPTSASDSTAVRMSSELMPSSTFTRYGDLYVVEVATQRVAVTAKYVQLVGDSGRVAEDVARIGVLGHESKRLLLAAATDEDSRSRRTDGLGRTQGLSQLVVRAVERSVCRRSTSEDRFAASLRVVRIVRPRVGTVRRGLGAHARTTRRRDRVPLVPPESTSSVVMVLASSPGWRYVTPPTSRRTRSRSVCAATKLKVV